MTDKMNRSSDVLLFMLIPVFIVIAGLCADMASVRNWAERMRTLGSN